MCTIWGLLVIDEIRPGAPVQILVGILSLEDLVNPPPDRSMRSGSWEILVGILSLWDRSSH